MLASSLQGSASAEPSCCDQPAPGDSTAGGDAGSTSDADLGPGLAGRVESVAGTVAMIRANGAVEPAVPGAALFEGDFLQAAGSSVVVILHDGNRIAIQERGQLIVHAPGRDGGSSVEAAEGQFVFLSGPAPLASVGPVIDTPAARLHPGATDVAFRHGTTDGLRVILAENAKAKGPGVYIENSFGGATLSAGDEIAFAAGSDQPPVVEREPSLVDNPAAPPEAPAPAGIPSILALADQFETSPGGDENALPGDPIVVTGALGLFDLTPQPASLQEPAFTGILTSDSALTTPEPMTEELLIRSWQQQVLQQQLLQQEQLQQEQPGTGPTVRQLRDWEPLGLIWDILGNAQVTQPVPDVGPGRLFRPIVPTEAASMALVVPSTNGMGPVDDFLGLPVLTIANALPTTRPASVSAIRSTPVQLTAGTELSFDWFFDAANESPRRDTALFVIDGRVFALTDASKVTSHGATGWRTFAFRVERSGLYTLGFVTVNDLTTDDPLRLFVDNVRRDRTFGDDYVVVDSGAGWRTLVQKPTLRDDTLVVGEDARGATTALALLANDSDPDPFNPMGIVALDRAGTRGSPSFSGTGTITFDPAGQFDGLAAGETATTSFRYEADSGSGVRGFATVHVTVIGANDAPTARTDALAAVAANASAVVLPVLANDDDVDSDDDRSTLRVVAAEAASGATVQFSALLGEGIIYRPGNLFQALAAGETATDTVTYTIQDRHGARAAAAATVTLVGVNDAPTAFADVTSGGEDAALTLSVLANDIDPDTTDQLRISAVSGTPIAAGGSVLLASGAAVSLTIDRTLTYDPRGRFDRLALGEAASDSFRYQIDDGHGGLADALVTVNLIGANDAPTAASDSAPIDADGEPLAIDALLNDDDIDSDDDRATLRIVAAGASSGAAVTFTGQPGAGLTYDPADLFRSLGEGETGADIITYTIEDRHGARSTATVAVTVRGVNDAPTALADVAAAHEDAAVDILVRANDTDPDSRDILTIVGIDGQPLTAGSPVTLASGAVVGLNAAGSLSWSPAGRFDGLSAGQSATDTFRYRISDGHGGFSEAEVTVRVEGRNDAPVAAPDQALAGEDGPAVAIDVLSNDDDVDSDDSAATLRVVAAQAASGAAVTIGTGGRLGYSAAGYWDRLGISETGIDTITYTVEDRHGARSTGVVTVTVTGTNDAPTAVADRLMIDADTVLRLPGPSVMANDRDPDLRDTRTIIAIDGLAANVGRTIALASGALLTVEANGTLTYDPNGRFTGLTDFERATDSFTYTIADGSGLQSTATVTVQIQGKNDDPVANADTVITDADSSVRIPVLINDTDPDAGGNLRVLEVDTANTQGRVRINGDGTLTWDAGGAFNHLAAGEEATDTFSYVVDDFVGGRSTAVVTVTVVGRGTPSSSPQELLQSFETGPLPSQFAQFLGNVAVGTAPPAPAAALFRPTHHASMAVLTADGSQAAAIERYLSQDVTVGGRPLISLPSDTVANSSPTSGSAIRTSLALGPHDIGNGRITVSFDWNFISAETPAQSNLNDYAVFTVTDGQTARIFKLSDSRGTSGLSDGWRTSTFDLRSVFALPAAGELRVTVGFAVLNDETPANPSYLLIDNVRLNRPFDSGYELVRSEAGGSFVTYRGKPAAVDDTYATALTEDAMADLSSAALLANDAPSSGAGAESLRLITLDTTATIAAVSMRPGGSIAWDPRGRFDFLAQGEIGIDSFGYVISDANGGTGTGRVTMTVGGLNDAPVSGLDASAAEENGAPVAIDVLANDDDVDSDDDATTLRVVAASAASGAMVTFSGLAGAGIVYHPGTAAQLEALAEGETLVDLVAYTIEDRHGARADGILSVTVTGRNDAPTAAADTFAGDEDSRMVISALDNDRDPDVRDQLAIIAINGQAIAPGGSITLGSGALVQLGNDGTLFWDPTTSFAFLSRGQTSTDSFVYTLSDGHGGTSSARVDISVAGRNDAPVAATDALLASAGARLTIAAATLLANDSDADAGDALRLVGVNGSGSTGSVSYDGSSIIWDPLDRFRYLGAGETAIDSFSYQIADNDGAVSNGTVSLSVVGVNDAPVALDDVTTTDEDTAITLNVLGNDTDPDLSDRISMLWVDTAGTRGQVIVNDDGTVVYDPRGQFDYLNAGQTAYDVFRYRVTDGHGAVDEAVVTVTVTGRSDTERLVDSFEQPFSFANRTGTVSTVLQHQETDGARALFNSTDGSWLARLEAAGATAPTLQTFLGQPAGSLPKDIDGTFPAQGSAAKLSLTVQAGDEVSFDWMFDARDFVFNPPDGRADNDFAVFSVTGAGTPQLFKLSDVRQTGDQGASGWRSSVFVAPTSGEITIGFAAVNDRVAGLPVSENSVLLVDNVRLNREFGPGYQVVDTQGDGRFETLMPA